VDDEQMKALLPTNFTSDGLEAHQKDCQERRKNHSVPYKGREAVNSVLTIQKAKK
jgi:hypothetical protein